MPICVWLRIVGQVLIAAGGRRFLDGRGRARRPIAQQLAHQVLQPLPIDLAGHAEDRAVGAITALEICGRMSSIVVASRAFCSPWAEPAPGLGIVLPPQLDHHLLRPARLPPPAAPAASPAGRLPTDPRANAGGATRRRRWPAPRADSRPAWPRCSWYGPLRPTRSVPRPGCRDRG